MLNCCKTCGAKLGERNKKGYCRSHLSAAMAQDPAWREKQRKGIRDKIANDPQYLADCRARADRLAKDPGIKAMRAEQFRRLRVWECGTATQKANPEIRKRAGRTLSDRKMAWCPPHLRNAYRELLYTKGYLAADARALILEQERREIERLRIRMGVSPISGEHVEPPVVKKPGPPIQLPPRLETDGPVLTFTEVIAVISEKMQVPIEDLLGPSRLRNVVQARFTCFTALYLRGSSLSAIGRRFDRDHTTVMHGVRVFEDTATPEMREIVNSLVSVVKEAA